MSLKDRIARVTQRPCLEKQRKANKKAKANEKHKLDQDKEKKPTECVEIACIRPFSLCSFPFI